MVRSSWPVGAGTDTVNEGGSEMSPTGLLSNDSRTWWQRCLGALVAAAAAMILALLLAVPAHSSTTLAWGEDFYGQLGTGSTGDSAVPVAVPGVSEGTLVAAGGRNSLVLLANGTVAGWGSDGVGELGDGSTVRERDEPVLASGLGEVAAISAGHKFSLALLKNGTVMSWGDNKYGQLGTGNGEFLSVPKEVKGLSGATAVSAGFFHSLALLSDGSVMAWGNGRYGDLGNGSVTDSYSPKPVTGLSNVTAVSAGCIHSLALLSNGTVVSFGGNEYAQLGHGPKNTQRTALPQPVIGLKEVKAISAGLFYNLALLQDGTVMAWGYNHSGQLGNGKANSGPNGTPTPVSGLSEVAAISAAAGSMSVDRSSQHSLALLKNGAVMAWGGNEFGQLGTGTTQDALQPQPVVGLTSGVTAISSGGFHSLAIR
jgi:alpha-tubulin suppressor-like RCC1 family protein